MYALVSLIIVISLSMLVVRVGTVALTMTGLSEDVASFQSLSASPRPDSRPTRPRK